MSRDWAGDGAREKIQTVRRGAAVDLEELRRRNGSAVAVDLLYLFATGFLATLAVRGFWPAVIAAGPLVAFLYFAWRSSGTFFAAQLVAIALSVVATWAGVLPL